MIISTVTGNLGKSAEVRNAGGTPVCSFSVASNTKVKGEKVTTWVKCSLWGKRGESLAQYLTQGTRVAAVGELTTREYEGKTYIELRVDQIDLMGGGQRAESNGGAAPKGDAYEGDSAPKRGDAYEGDSAEPNW